jgi:uncharacterized protein YegP (UPF0339 family)
VEVRVKFHYWKSNENGKWSWHLLAGTGEIIASGVGYVHRVDCLNAITCVKSVIHSTMVSEIADPIHSMQRTSQNPHH